MRQFLFKLLLFLTIFCFLLALINIHHVKIDNPSDYIASIIDKHERAQKIKTPKIIFAGGSHLAFGLDSEAIEKEFKVPVVNLGINAGLGLSFMLEEVKDVINENDIIIISFAYLQNNDGILELKNMASEYYKYAQNFYTFSIYEKIKLFLINTRKKYIDLINIFLINRSNATNIKVLNDSNKISVYSRHAFNNYGDVVAHLNLKSRKKLLDKEIFSYQYWKGIRTINKFSNYVQKRNTKIYFLYPNMTVSEYNKNQQIVQKLASDIEKYLNIEKLNTPASFVFDDNLFFDTVYHLNKDGRAIKTKKIIGMIKKNGNLYNHLKTIRQKYYQTCCAYFN